MNSYLFQNNNEIILTESTGALTEKSNSVDAIRIIVPKVYNDTFNMAEFDGIFEYKLPISNANGFYQLVLTDADYKNDFLLYTLPDTMLTTALTNECGDVEFNLHFVKAELDTEGNTVERVRQSVAPAVMKIVPIASWLTPSEQSLSSLASLYLENKKLALALAELANSLNLEKANDIVLDVESGKVILSANGTKIGTGITLDALNTELVETGGSSPSSGNISIQQI